MRWLALLSPMIAACVDLPEFPRASLIDRPRVLAIVAEPPEARPGQAVELALLLAGASSAQVSWRACGAFDSFLGGGSQYGEESDEEHCGSDRGETLPDGETTLLSGELTERLFDDLELASAILGSALPAQSVMTIRDQVGLPFLVEATIIADGKMIRAVKRVLISERASAHGNPPPPRFSLAGQEIAALKSRRFACAALDGVTPREPPDRELELIPTLDAEQESWLEPYPVLTSRGELAQRSERALYSWFSTGGRFAEEMTRAPLRNQVWRTPERSGCHGVWLVIRDGHGGTSACGVDVAIGESSCP
jgi:hypothetical protein